jgi:nitrous oxidase accessory protein NosD
MNMTASAKPSRKAKSVPHPTTGLTILAAAIFVLFRAVPLQGATILVEEGESIKAAAEAAASGDEILVGPGEYRERIYMEYRKNVTIRSLEGPASTRILLQDEDQYGFQVRFSQNITISGFSILGAEHGTDCTDLSGGVFFVDSSGTVENCIIDLFTGPERDKLCYVSGITLQAWIAPGPIELVVRDCTIRGFRLQGIFAFGNGRQVKAYRNRIEGIGPSSGPVQYGMLVRNFASVIAEGNIISGHEYYDPQASTAGGILAYGAETSLSHASFNNFGDNQAAILSYDASGTKLSTPKLPADDNYWGDPSGPGGNGVGVGDAQFGAIYTTIWDQVHAYDPYTGRTWGLQTNEGRLIGARFIDRNHLYPEPTASPFLRDPWLEYKVVELPLLGHPMLLLFCDTNIPSPASFQEYSIRDDSLTEPFWHAQPVVGDDGNAMIGIRFGTQGALGNESSSWIAGGAFEPFKPRFIQPYFDDETNEFVLAWSGEPGHTFRVERAFSPNGTFEALEEITLDGPEGIFADPVIPEQSAFFYRIIDLGP